MTHRCDAAAHLHLALVRLLGQVDALSAHYGFIGLAQSHYAADARSALARYRALAVTPARGAIASMPSKEDTWNST